MADKSAIFEAKYLGHLPCLGIWGHEFSDPPTVALMKEKAGKEIPTMLFEFTSKELKITELVPKKGKPQKVKRPAVSLKDVTFAIQMEHPSDMVVSAIYVGYNATSSTPVHVHVYVFKSAEMAAVFVHRLASHLMRNENQHRHLKMEAQLINKGVVQPSRLSEDGRGVQPLLRKDSKVKESPPALLPKPQVRKVESEEPAFDMAAFEEEAGIGSEAFPEQDYDDKDLRTADTLATELKNRLKSKEKAPMLLPPKDYDTVHRIKGNLSEVNMRRALNKELVGESVGVYGSSAEIAEEIRRSSSEAGELNGREAQEAQRRAQKAFNGYIKSDPSRYISDKPQKRLSAEPLPVTPENGPYVADSGIASVGSDSPRNSTGRSAMFSISPRGSAHGDPRDQPEVSHHSRVDNNFDVDDYLAMQAQQSRGKGPPPAVPHKRLPRVGQEAPSVDTGSRSSLTDSQPSPRKPDADLYSSMPVSGFNYMKGPESAREYAPMFAHKRSSSGAT